MIMPGVQKPHWSPCFSQNAFWIGCRVTPSAMPSIVVTLRAVGLHGEHRAALHGLAVDVDGAGPALAGVAADVGAREVEVLPDHLDEEPSWLDVDLPVLTVHIERDVQIGHRDDLLPRSGVATLGVARSRLPAGLRASPDGPTVAARTQPGIARVAPGGPARGRRGAWRGGGSGAPGPGWPWRGRRPRGAAGAGSGAPGSGPFLTRLCVIETWPTLGWGLEVAVRTSSHAATPAWVTHIWVTTGTSAPGTTGGTSPRHDRHDRHAHPAHDRQSGPFRPSGIRDRQAFSCIHALCQLQSSTSAAARSPPIWPTSSARPGSSSAGRSGSSRIVPAPPRRPSGGSRRAPHVISTCSPWSGCWRRSGSGPRCSSMRATWRIDTVSATLSTPG